MFNQKSVTSYSGGAKTAFASPLGAYSGSQIALNTITSGTTVSTAGLVIAVGAPQFDIEWESLAALVETDITTSTITVLTKWQVSPDGSNWVDYFGKNTAANVQKAAAGTGSLVTTQWFQSFDGSNPSFKYIRMAVQVGVTTGAAGDNVTVSYFWRKRATY